MAEITHIPKKHGSWYKLENAGMSDNSWGYSRRAYLRWGLISTQLLPFFLSRTREAIAGQGEGCMRGLCPGGSNQRSPESLERVLTARLEAGVTMNFS